MGKKFICLKVDLRPPPPRIDPVIMLEQGSKKGELKWPEEATDLSKSLTGYGKQKSLSVKDPP